MASELAYEPDDYDDLGFLKKGVANTTNWPVISEQQVRIMSHADHRLMLAKEAMAVFLQDELNHMGEKINERRIAFRAVQMADRVLAQLAIPAGQKDA